MAGEPSHKNVALTENALCLLSNVILCCHSLLPTGRRPSRLTYSSHRLGWWMWQMWVPTMQACSGPFSRSCYLFFSPHCYIFFRSPAPSETSRTSGLVWAHSACQHGPVMVSEPGLICVSMPFFHGFVSLLMGQAWSNSPIYNFLPETILLYPSLKTQEQGPFI